MTQDRLPRIRFEALKQRVVLHAVRDGSLPAEAPFVHLLRAMSDLGELAGAENSDDVIAIRDAVGHVLMRMIHFCARRQVDPVECLYQAAFRQNHRF